MFGFCKANFCELNVVMRGPRPIERRMRGLRVVTDAIGRGLSVRGLLQRPTSGPSSSKERDSTVYGGEYLCLRRLDSARSKPTGVGRSDRRGPQNDSEAEDPVRP